MTKLSASEKEKTKLRERNRRSITTKIFQGLRKYGGYNLAPRADINEVLRCLAAEAGWTVEEDGTTYRTPPGGVPPLRQASGSSSGRPVLLNSSTVMAGTSGLLNTPLSGGALLLGGSGVLGHSGGTAFLEKFSMHHHHSHNQHLEAISSLLDSRGGDCSTTASPRHHGGNSSAGNLFSPRQQASQQANSDSFFSVPFGACGCTTATHTPTSSMSFLPSTSSFASPASSEVQEAAAYQCSTSKSAASTVPATQYPQVHANYASPLNYPYYFPSPIPDIKEDLLGGVPLEFCSFAANASAGEAAGSCQNPLQMPFVACYPAQEAERQQQDQAMIPSSIVCAAGQSGCVQARAHMNNSIFSPVSLLQQANPFLQEARASNHNTPLGTPLGSPQHYG